MRRIAAVIAGVGIAALAACGAQGGATGITTTVDHTTTVVAEVPPTGHAAGRNMPDDQANARACRIYADSENRITTTWDAFASAQKADDKSAHMDLLHAYQDARADWLAAVGAALAVAPNNHIYAAMAHAPAFYRYWAGTGTQEDGAATYAYSLVLSDIETACADAGQPMNLIPSTQGRVGLPKNLQRASG